MKKEQVQAYGPCPGQIAMDERYFIDEQTALNIENVDKRVAVLKQMKKTEALQYICRTATGFSLEELTEYLESAKQKHEKLTHALTLYNCWTRAHLRLVGNFIGY